MALHICEYFKFCKCREQAKLKKKKIRQVLCRPQSLGKGHVVLFAVRPGCKADGSEAPGNLGGQLGSAPGSCAVRLDIRRTAKAGAVPCGWLLGGRQRQGAVPCGSLGGARQRGASRQQRSARQPTCARQRHEAHGTACSHGNERRRTAASLPSEIVEADGKDCVAVRCVAVLPLPGGPGRQRLYRDLLALCRPISWHGSAAVSRSGRLT